MFVAWLMSVNVREVCVCLHVQMCVVTSPSLLIVTSPPPLLLLSLSS